MSSSKAPSLPLPADFSTGPLRSPVLQRHCGVQHARCRKVCLMFSVKIKIEVVDFIIETFRKVEND